MAAKNPTLVPVHLRLRKQDVEQAKREAAILGTPYQHVIRGWVMSGALQSIATSTGSSK